MTQGNKLPTDPYKGVRDFYPEDEAVQKYIYKVWRETVEKFGFVQYDASILEPTELYKQKSGEEIINEQTYSFLDRGEREVTLRPEMTPTVARMVAHKKRELSFPLRWYSIPNLFRYERPQRGRLREHFQLNCDIFGVSGVEAEIELISMSYAIMKAFGARDGDFEIRVSSRKMLNQAFDKAGLSPEQKYKMQKLLDRKSKIDNFDEEVGKLLGKDINIEFAIDDETSEVISVLRELGIQNVIYAPEIVRGFDYYTGIVFEIYDTNPENNRAMFGGGRYDDLLALFSDEKVPAVGFGMGDVTIRDFLESRNLLPTYTSTAKLYIANAGASFVDLHKIAEDLREQGINVAVDMSGKKLGDQIKKAVKDSIEFVAVIGSEEIESRNATLKHLASEEETKVPLSSLGSYIKNF